MFGIPPAPPLYAPRQAVLPPEACKSDSFSSKLSRLRDLLDEKKEQVVFCEEALEDLPYKPTDVSWLSVPTSVSPYLLHTAVSRLAKRVRGCFDVDCFKQCVKPAESPPSCVEDGVMHCSGLHTIVSHREISYDAHASSPPSSHLTAAERCGWQMLEVQDKQGWCLCTFRLVSVKYWCQRQSRHARMRA